MSTNGTEDHKARTNHETVREALNRHEFQEEYGGELLAHGQSEGVDVLIAAQLAKGKYPELVVHAGGELEVYDEDDLAPEYVGGVTVTNSYDRVDMLETGFTALAEKYGLEEITNGD